MKFLLCSNFRNVAEKFLSLFFDLNKTHTCLFVGYADEDNDFYSESSTQFLQSLNFKVFHLNENFEFDDAYDMIFVKGGNTTKLVHLLHKFNQFNKIKELVEKGSVYVGQSAGAVLGGSDTEWTLRSEPYDYDVKAEFGENALKGFGFVDKMVFVHASKYRFPFNEEVENAKINNFRVKNTLFYGDYLIDRKNYDKSTYIKLGDNEALYGNGGKQKFLRFDWSKIPVHDEFRLF